MNNIYWQSKCGNFGDDLNSYLWPLIWGNDFVNKAEDIDFIGIGSVLGSDFLKNKIRQRSRKIVFGTGFRPSNNSFDLDLSWDIAFLRGPLSAYSLNQKNNFISDAAYAYALTSEYSIAKEEPKKYKYSLFPYFRSAENINWEKIAKRLGVHYISPLSENGVESTLLEIAQSNYIITEAMHGAILADVLRVPWHRFLFSSYIYEGPDVSDFKWNDWLFSINIGNIEKSKFALSSGRFSDFLRYYIYRQKKYFGFSKFFEDHISEIIIKDNFSFYLSSDQTFSYIVDQLFEKSDYIRNKYL